MAGVYLWERPLAAMSEQVHLTGLHLALWFSTRHCSRDVPLTHGSLRSALLRSMRHPGRRPCRLCRSPKPADSTMSGRAAGRIFFSGSKAQRSEPFRKKMMLAASPCEKRRGHGPLLQVKYNGLLYGAAYRAVTDSCKRGQTISHGCIAKAVIQEDVRKLPFFSV